MSLKTEPNLPEHDEFYAKLMTVHRDLTEAESLELNARLVLLLANHIGDMGVLEEAIAKARQN